MSSNYSLEYCCRNIKLTKFVDTSNEVLTVDSLVFENEETGEVFSSTDEALITAYCATRMNFLDKFNFEYFDEFVRAKLGDEIVLRKDVLA